MISVIIPTYNRAVKLSAVLNSLEQQTLAKNLFEVIIIDDGSNDQTEQIISAFIQKKLLALNYYRQDHSGPGAARNLGVAKARGDIIFFCGDDAVFDKNLLKIHLAHHNRNKNIAVLGLALWLEPASDFMKYLAPAGPQFRYQTITDYRDAGFSHFYTVNLSLEKKWFVLEKFDTIFTAAAFEDIDLGLRLEKRDLKILYDPQAIIYHDHKYSEEQFYRRIEKVGKGFLIFINKYRGDRASQFKIRLKYGPFTCFGMTRPFNLLSRGLMKSGLIKRLNIKYHWFWSICYFYSKGILDNAK